MSDNRDGSRTVQLYAPFEFTGRSIDAITIGPIKLDHILRFRSGQIGTLIALLAETTGHAEVLLRELRYPDADRVLTAFMAMLPNDIREDIIAGRVMVHQPGNEFRQPEVSQSRPIPTPTPNETTAAVPQDDNPVEQALGFKMEP